MSCLSPEIIASYIENTLNGDEREQAEKHFSECDNCTAFLVDASNIKVGIIESVPEKWESELIRNISDKKDMFDIILQIAGDKIKAILNESREKANRWTVIIGGDLAIEPVRGEKTYPDNFLKLRKRCNNLLIELEIESVEDNLCDVKLIVKDEKGKNLEKSRISLNSLDRELESYMIKDGFALFERVKVGKYFIDIVKEKKSIAKVSINLESIKKG